MQKTQNKIEAMCESTSENLVNDTMISWNKVKSESYFISWG